MNPFENIRSCLGCQHFEQGVSTSEISGTKRVVYTAINACNLAEDDETDDETAETLIDHLLTDAGTKCPHYAPFDPDDDDDMKDEDGDLHPRRFGISFDYLEDDENEEDDESGEE